MPVSIDEGEIQRLVEEVMRRVENGQAAAAPEAAPGGPRPLAVPGLAQPAGNGAAPAPAPAAAGLRDGIFTGMDEAIAAAEHAYQAFAAVSLGDRKVFLQAMRRAAEQHAEAWARRTVEETGFGCVAHKVQKILLSARATPGVEDLAPLCYTGDDGMTLVEPAPFGVIGAVTPCTNPAPTIVNNALSIVAAGNAVVFNPHPAAKEVSNHAVQVLNQAIREAGGPSTLLCSIGNPTMESSQALMNHPGVRLMLVTGGGAVVEQAMRCGKRTVAAGPGNPPVIVDDTADIHKAARCIVDGASFDNNVLCTAEKEVFVFAPVADQLMAEMASYGAYRITGDQIDALSRILVKPGEPYAHPDKQFVGQDAPVLLQQIGVRPERDVRLVICEVPFEHPLVQTEMLMPILPVVRVADLDEALARAKQAEHGRRHSAMMHSESVSNMSRVARAIETTIFVKNAPSYAGLGFGGEGFSTMSIAGPTGEGLTSARTFTRQRRCVLAGAFRII